MDHYVGIDVSLEQSSVCVVDAGGRIVREAKVASEPDALVQFLNGLAVPLARVGLEAGPLSQWLYAGLAAAGFEAVLLETRHVKAALSAMVVKTDRKDARGIAQLLRMGWFRPVHCKSPPAQEIRALLVARKQLQAKTQDVELSLRGLLRGFGLKLGEVSKGRFAARVRDLAAGHPVLEPIAAAMLRAREALRQEFAKLHRAMLTIARADPVCRQLMTVPGVGAVIAVTFTSAVDDPRRFAKSAALGAHFGLTPKKYQSGERDVTGAISKAGDGLVRAALYEAAHIMLTRTVRFSALKRWALAVAKRRGMKRAKVALARKLAVVMHAMWRDGTAFRWGKQSEAQAA
jgi:transposase